MAQHELVEKGFVFGNKSLHDFITGVEQGHYQVAIDREFKFEEIVEAHRYMESNQAKGKLVVVVA